MDVFNQIDSTNALLLLGVFGVLLLIQLYYLLFIYSKLTTYKVSQETADGEVIPLSVIICARNEEDNLRQNLPKILHQDYPEFEVILVNDFSEDESKWLLKE